ncbi:MAG TPA: Fe-S cluster assembly protein SufD [Candidatus Baltobacteraceae bacterium]
MASVNPTLLEERRRDSISPDLRRAALKEYASLPPVRHPQGRYWKHDYSLIDLSQPQPREPMCTTERPQRAGVVVISFSQARSRHNAAFEAAFGRARTGLDDRFAAAALAFQNAGTFVHISAGTIVDEPIVISYDASGDCFPYTLISLEPGARATIVEEFTGAAGAVLCGISEVVLAAGASLTYACMQDAAPDARVFFTRRARCEAKASLRYSLAELGGTLVHTTVRSTLAETEASAEVTSLFFNNHDQHVDLATDVEHVVGPTRSLTIVRSVGTGRGQGRYLGNIAIRPGAKGAEAALRDNVLLLSKAAHIDSIPALEIASNDVKAFHGATVGSIDEEELFYVTSRGIARHDAERMIALGFFEPAIEHFPGEALRARLRVALEGKLE